MTYSVLSFIYIVCTRKYKGFNNFYLLEQFLSSPVNSTSVHCFHDIFPLIRQLVISINYTIPAYLKMTGYIFTFIDLSFSTNCATFKILFNFFPALSKKEYLRRSRRGVERGSKGDSRPPDGGTGNEAEKADPGISMPTKLTKLRYSGYSAEFLDRVEPNGNIPAKNGSVITGRVLLNILGPLTAHMINNYFHGHYLGTIL